jgi:hypothetical protein
VLTTSLRFKFGGVLPDEELTFSNYGILARVFIHELLKVLADPLVIAEVGCWGVAFVA